MDDLTGDRAAVTADARRTVSVVNGLEQESDRINQTVNHIADFTGRATLLPLNETFEAARAGDALNRAIADFRSVNDLETEMSSNDGPTRFIEECAGRVRSTLGEKLFGQASLGDIPQRERDEERMRLLAGVLENVTDGVLIVGSTLTLELVNPAYEEMAQCKSADIVGCKVELFAPDFHNEPFVASVWREVIERGRWQGEAMCWRKSADPFHGSLNIIAIENDEAAARYFIIVCSDISILRQQEQRIWRLANYDDLTTLPNRWLVLDRLNNAIKRLTRGTPGFAILLIGVHNIKYVSDSFGYQTGDDLLRQIAMRLHAAVRASDTVGRFGVDEFLIIAPGVTTDEAAARIASKIVNIFSDPFEVGKHKFSSDASIGIAYCPRHGGDADEILHNVTIAKLWASNNRDRKFACFDPDIQTGSAHHSDVESALHRAVERNQLVLHYQPKIETQSGAIVAAEALVRWRHPERGMIQPNDFIPLAEKLGLIISIGEWNIREACQQFLRWRSCGVNIDSISVNLSPLQFLDARLSVMLERILSETGMDPTCLELELTEGAMVVDLDKAICTLKRLKALGLRISIDDFGTGYSSLARLQQLPVDVVKIDKFFVQELETNPTASRIIDAIISLADVLGFEIVAEGIETEGQASILRSTRCHFLQGYLISHPLNAAAFTELALSSTPVMRRS